MKLTCCYQKKKKKIECSNLNNLIILVTVGQNVKWDTMVDVLSYLIS